MNKVALEKCPICRARIKSNNRLCRRCGADLSDLEELSQKAEACFLNSIELLSSGRCQAAHQAAMRSVKLKSDPLFVAWLSFVEERISHDRFKTKSECSSMSNLC